jgi:transposase
LQAIVDQLAALELRVGTLDRAIHARHRANDMSCRLETVPGIGVIGYRFHCHRSERLQIRSRFCSMDRTCAAAALDGRQGAARRYLQAGRSLSPEVARHRCNGRRSKARRHPQKHSWIMRLPAKKPAKLVAVVVANKMARIAWAIMAKGGYNRAPELAAAT